MEYIFFFQAEDGIRDDLVTGVQTCALPIYAGAARDSRVRGLILEAPHVFVEELGLESIRAIAEAYRERGEGAGRMPTHRPQDAGAPIGAAVGAPGLRQQIGRAHV